MLQSKLSMTQLGVFSLAGYPYSFKLLWSPIVDSLFSRRLGRRKSWVVPVQAASAALLLCGGSYMQRHYDAGDVGALTALFFVFVLLAATQVGACARIINHHIDGLSWAVVHATPTVCTGPHSPLLLPLATPSSSLIALIALHCGRGSLLCQPPTTTTTTTTPLYCTPPGHCC